MHGEIVLQDVLCRETLAASTWEEDSDDETWESESFESTLSSIAAFDMAGALERMSSAEKFYTPEAADSVLLANGAFQDITCRPQAECSAPELDLAREKPSAYAPEAASAVKGSQERSRSPEAEETVLAPTLARGEPVAATSVQSSSPGGSSDSDGGLSVFAWAAGRSITRRHILARHCRSRCARMPMMLNLLACLIAWVHSRHAIYTNIHALAVLHVFIFSCRTHRNLDAVSRALPARLSKRISSRKAYTWQLAAQCESWCFRILLNQRVPAPASAHLSLIYNRVYESKPLL